MLILYRKFYLDLIWIDLFYEEKSVTHSHFLTLLTLKAESFARKEDRKISRI